MGNLYNGQKKQIKQQITWLPHPRNPNMDLLQQSQQIQDFQQQTLDCPPILSPKSIPLSQQQAIAEHTSIQIQQLSEKQIKILNEQVNLPQKIIDTLTVHQNNKQKLSTSQCTDRSLNSNYIYDPEAFQAVIQKLIATYFPSEEVKRIKLLERKRTCILWLKQRQDSQKERQRDTVLRNEGYQVYTSHEIDKIFQKYEQQSTVSLRITVLLLYSYSSSNFFKNDDIIKQLYEKLVQKGKISKLHIVKPYQQKKYQRYSENGKKQLKIVEFPYQVELIRLKIAEMENLQSHLSINIAPLIYWDQEAGLIQLLKNQPFLVSTSIKIKVTVSCFLVIGKAMLFKIESDKEFIKRIIYSYAILHDLYFSSSSFTINANKKQQFMERIGMKLIEDPLSFYCEPTNEILINRLIKYCGDEPSYLSNIALPITLIQNKIKEQYRENRKSKRYIDEFICYYETFMNEEELRLLTKKTVFQNVGFIKASLKPSMDNQQNLSIKTNTLIKIFVTPKHKNEQFDKGYSFTTSSNEVNTGNNYFSGFKHVIFNILNSFMVMDHHYDTHKGKHIIELEYGYIASHIQFKISENTIAEDGVYLKTKKRLEQQLDEKTVVKFQSNAKIIEKIQDYGDCVSLFGHYNDAIRYYGQLFRRHKAEMDRIGSLFGHLQMKKAKNYGLSNNLQTSLQTYYHAFNYFHKGAICLEIQDIYLKVMRNLYQQGSYDKAIRYGGNILTNAKAQKNLSFYQSSFLLQLYTCLAQNYQQRITINFQFKHQQLLIMEYYQKALQIVDQIGEYNELVPPFYVSFGRYLLMARKPVQSLIYINKSLLLKKTMLRQIHPDLCPIYELLSVAYINVHDYQQALKAINNCINIYLLYYSAENYRFTVPLQLQAKIYGLMNNFTKSLQIFEMEMDLLMQLCKKQKITQSQQRKGRFNSNNIGLFNVFEQKHLNPYIDGYFKEDKSEICLVYVYIYMASIEKVRYRFNEASQYLNLAYNLNCQQLGQNHRLNVHILMKMAQINTACCNWSKALQIFKDCWGVIGKVKRQTGLEGADYYQLMGKLYEKKGDYHNSLSNYNKQKQIKFKFYGRQHLQTCKANDNLGRVNIGLKKLLQAKNFFDESQKARRYMLDKAVEDPKSTGMFGPDLQDFIKDIKLGLCSSLQNSGLLLFTSDKLDESLLKYQNALAETINLIGQYHPKTASIYKQLGRVYHQLGGYFIDQSLISLNRSLSIYKSLVNYNRQYEIEVYCLLAVVQETRNQPALALEQLKQSIVLMRNIKLIWIRFDEAVHNFSRLVDLIVAHANLSHLKIAYYTITKLFEEQRENKTGLADHKYRPEVKEKILGIISKISQIRDIINELEGVSQPEDNQHKLHSMQVKSGNLNLQSIKDNMFFRKQRRENNKQRPLQRRSPVLQNN